MVKWVCVFGITFFYLTNFSFLGLAQEKYKFVLQWGGYGYKEGQFDFPYDLAVDSVGYIYVVDRGNYRIQKFKSNGDFLGWWGKDDLGNTGWHNPGSGRAGVGGSGDGEFSYPAGIEVDSSGNVYVSEEDNNRIQKFTSTGTFLGWWGKDDSGNTGWHAPGSGRKGVVGSGDGEFSAPEGIAVDSEGNIYVADYYNNCIQKFTPDGNFIRRWGSGGRGDGEFWCPEGIAVDSSGYVYVTDYHNHRIQKFNRQGKFLGWWGGDDLGNTGWHPPGSGRVGVDGSGDGQFNQPYSIAFSPSRYVYVADTYNHRIQKFNRKGKFLGWWGKDDLGNTGWHNPGSGRVGVEGSGEGEFCRPFGIAVDSSGYIYVLDNGNHRIQKFRSSMSRKTR